jgi:hypothetical protein
VKVARLSAQRTGRLYPQEIFLVLISVRGWVDPRAIVRPEELLQWKIPVTPSGVDPATFRFCSAVPQPLRHRVPPLPQWYSLQILWNIGTHFWFPGSGRNLRLFKLSCKSVIRTDNCCAYEAVRNFKVIHTRCVVKAVPIIRYAVQCFSTAGPRGKFYTE